MRRSKVVILDEATANIDVVTEQAIQKLVSEEFLGATVLTIAHRLNTIIKSDKILLLDQGRIVEFATPASLLKDPKSAFASLAQDIQKTETNH